MIVYLGPTLRYTGIDGHSPMSAATLVCLWLQTKIVDGSVLRGIPKSEVIHMRGVVGPTVGR